MKGGSEVNRARALRGLLAELSDGDWHHFDSKQRYMVSYNDAQDMGEIEERLNGRRLETRLVGARKGATC